MIILEYIFVMARTAKFDSDQFIDAALDLVAEHGPAGVTIDALAKKLNAPVGSVYHRFASRDVLMARLWLRTVEMFQQEFIDVLRRKDGLAAALFTTQWVRDHPKEARLLLLHRREELMSGSWPKEVQDLAKRVADDMNTALVAFTRDLLGETSEAALRRIVFALIDIPYAAVRRSLLAGKTPPADLDDLIAETCTALLGGKS